MQLQSIKISGFLGVDSLDVDLRGRTTLLLSGGNAAGKTSVIEAVRLALTGDLPRIALKKDASALVRNGHQAGASVSLVTTDGEAFSAGVTKAGALKTSVKDADPRLRFVLDAGSLARLDAKDRRAFLADLAGVRADADDLVRRLGQRGCDSTRVERLRGSLRAGFEAAAADAGQHAANARAAWRALTGEAYGTEKAATWRAPAPAVDAEALKAALTEVEQADHAIGQWNRTVGELTALERRRAELASTLATKQAQAAKRDSILAKLAADEATLADVLEQLARAEAAAGTAPRVGLVHDLAVSLRAMLDAMSVTDDEGLFGHAEPVIAARDALARYEAQHGKISATTGGGDPQAAARLPALRQGVANATSAIDNDRRDLAARDAAAVQVDAITAELAQPFDAESLRAARDQVSAITAAKSAAQERCTRLQAAKRLADAADQNTATAAHHDHDAKAWAEIAEALSPNGIPSELLAASLTPINRRLAASAQVTGWPHVTIRGDIDITVGDRPYRLASESERWRADAMLAEAVSFLSKTGLLVLDRADVLEPAQRPALIDWLDELADGSGLGTAIVCMTLKQAPQALPASMLGVWMFNGRDGGQKSAAAAQKEREAA